jgi:O-antigen/teichoic acid export membrane protein
MFKLLLERNPFLKNILILTSGTVLAQTVSVLIAPLLTRLYTPEQFGVFGIYFTIITIIGSIINGRYHLAIIIPKKDLDAFNLMIGSFLFSFIATIVFTLFILIIDNSEISILDSSKFSFYGYFLPFSVFLIGIYESLNYWILRNKKYQKASVSKVSQKIGEATLGLSLGLAGLGKGLILADIFGRLTMSCVAFFQSSLKFKNIKFKKIIFQLNKYRSFPLNNSFPTVLNVSSSHMPLLIISSIYTDAITGFFNLSRQVLSMPLSMISVSLSQVLLNEISEKIKSNLTIIGIFKKICYRLSLLALIMAIFISIFGPFLFKYIFGEAWLTAGYFSAILAIGFAIKFVVSPFSVLLYPLNKIKEIGYWQFFYFLMICSLFFFRSFNIWNFLLVLTIIEVIAYTIYFLLIYISIRSYEQSIGAIRK